MIASLLNATARDAVRTEEWPMQLWWAFWAYIPSTFWGAHETSQPATFSLDVPVNASCLMAHWI